ncbi:MAG: hypothetical protein ACJ8M1_15450 [Chthoniobacterales bacterium]
MHSRSSWHASSLILLLACLGFAATTFAAPEESAIIAATKKYLAANSYPPDIKIAVEKVAGDYARVSVTPASQQMDPAIAFLKSDHGAWKVLELGTGWDPADLAKLHIPKSLRP